MSASCRDHGIGLDELNGARAAFLEAGTEAICQAGQPEHWLQVNLYPDPSGATWLRLVRCDFQDWLATWLAQSPEHRFFYVCKAPGVRLRFASGDETFRTKLFGALDRIVDGPARWACAPYDAEWHQFGGSDGLDLTHRFFTIDSQAVLAFHRVRLHGGASLPPTAFSIALLCPLLREATGDPWELWDVWCNMTLTGRLPVPVGSAEWQSARPSKATHRAVLELAEPDGDRGRLLSEGESTVLERYISQAQPLAADVREADEHGRLLWGLREILPFWIVFHWNRMGLPLEDQQRLTTLMTHVLSPKEPPR